MTVNVRAHALCAHHEQLHLVSTMVFTLVLLFLTAGFCQRQVSAIILSYTGREHNQYTVRLEGYNLVIGISCQSESCKNVCQFCCSHSGLPIALNTFRI